LILGEDAFEAAKQYAKDTKKKATKKAKEAAEETSKAATKKKRKMISEL
jgi:vacuolar-type H+-ATPase subunit H